MYSDVRVRFRSRSRPQALRRSCAIADRICHKEGITDVNFSFRAGEGLAAFDVLCFLQCDQFVYFRIGKVFLRKLERRHPDNLGCLNVQEIAFPIHPGTQECISRISPSSPSRLHPPSA